MTLGMISWIREEDFQRVKAKGLSFVELDEYYGSNVPLFRRNGYRQSGVMIP